MSIGIGEVHLWVVPLDQDRDAVKASSHILHPEELSRADRFVTAELRGRYITCRGALRRILASQLGDVDPQEIQFEYGQWGKPQLAHRSSARLCFNVSHSSAWGLIGLANSPLGVDIEIPHERTHHRAIASQVLHPREAELFKSLPTSEFATHVMRLWVVKEALLKAMGLGIAEGLQQVSFPIPIPTEESFQALSIESALLQHLDDDGTCRMNHWTDPDTWRIQLQEPISGCYAAVATQRGVSEVVLHRE